MGKYESNQYKEQFNILSQYTDENVYLDELIKMVSKIIYDRNHFVQNSDNDSKRAEFYTYLRQKLQEFYNQYKENNNKSIAENIEFIGCGRTSLVFKIGNIVLKIGKEKSDYRKSRDYKFDCVIPVLYKEFFKVEDREFYVIEISPLVNTNNISEEEVYYAYRNLRKLGYIWNDPAMDNVGKVINDFTYGDINYKAGDIVIVDLEDLAYVGEETPDYVLDELAYYSYNQKAYVYENRYLEEKQSKIK